MTDHALEYGCEDGPPLRRRLLELPVRSHWLMEQPGWEDGAAAIERWLADVELGLSANSAAGDVEMHSEHSTT